MANNTDFKVKKGLVVSTTATVLGQTSATSTTTGALIVSGGAGIGGDLYVGGKIVAQELDIQYTTVTTTIVQTDDVIKTSNTTSATNTYTGALIIAGGGGFGGDLYARNIFSNGQQVGLQSNTTTNLAGGAQYAVPYQSGTGTTTFMSVPPVTGTTYLQFSTSTGFTWTSSVNASGSVIYTPYVDTFTGTGSATTWALSITPSGKNYVSVIIDGVDQLQSAWNLSGANIVFTEAPASGAVIEVKSISVNPYVATGIGDQGAFEYSNAGTLAGTAYMTYSSTTNVVSITTTTGSSSTTTGALTVVGGLGVGGGAYFGGTVTATTFIGNLTGTASSATYATNASTATYAQYASSSTYARYTSSSTYGTYASSSTYGTYASSATYATNASSSTYAQYASSATYATYAPSSASASSATYATYAGNAATANKVNNALSAGTGLTGTAFDGSAAVTWTLNTATLMQVATQVVQSHSTGTGILGSAYNGSTAQTWTLDTSTLMARAVQTVQSLTAGTGLSGTAFNGSTAQTWTVNTATLMQTASNLAGGNAGQFAYQSAGSTTAFMSTGSMYVYRATVADSASGSAGSVAFSHSTGTGILGVSYNGSAAVTWSLNTSTLMSSSTYATNASTATYAQYASSATYATYASSSTYGTYASSSTYAQYASSATYATYASSSTYGTYASSSTYAQFASSATYGTYASSATYATNAGVAQSVTNSVTFNNSNSGDASGTTYNGGTARTISANTLGALSLSGGGTVSGSVTFSGPVTFSGTATYALSTNTYYTDNIIELHTPPSGPGGTWSSDDGKDVGLRFHYYANAADANAALVLANDTKWLEFYSNGAEGANTFAGSPYGDFKTGGVWATRTMGVGYTSSQTGAVLSVNGGTYVNGIVTATTFVGNLTGTASSATYATYSSTATYAQYASSATYATYAGNAATANKVNNAHSAGTGLTGSAFDGSSAQTWTLNTATLMNIAVNLTGGAAGSLVYQSAANATTNLAIGTSGYVLTSNGSAPTWSAASGITAGNATSATYATYAGSAATANAVQATASATYYPTFVDSNNASSTAEIYYTTSTFTINPATGAVGVVGALNQSGGFAYLGNWNSGPSAGHSVPSLYSGTAFSWNLSDGGAEANIWNTSDPASYSGTGIRFLQRLTSSTYRDLMFLRNTGAISFGGLASYGSSGQVLQSNGDAAPTWVNASTLTAGNATSSTYATYAGNAATANKVNNAHTAGTGLSGTAFDGSAAQTWTLNTATLMNISVNLTGGAAGSLVYQSAANATTNLAIGTSGYVLTSNGSAPVWTAASGITAGNATSATYATYAGSAATANTIQATASASYYPTFVDSNNASSTAEIYYTTSSFYINPASGLTTIAAPAGGDGLPSLRVTQGTAPGTFNWAASFMNSSLGSSRNSIVLIGQAESNKNAGYIGFNHSGTAGSVTNFLTLGLHSVDNIMNITGNGYVGIGTTTPGAKLEIKSGDLWLNGATASDNPELRFIDDSGIATAGAKIRYGNSDGNLYFEHIWDNASSGFFFRNRTAGTTLNTLSLVNGFAGIGNTAPGFKLSVNTAADVWHAQFGTSGGKQLRIGGSTTAGSVIGAYNTDDNTSPATLLLQRDGGSVGIGVSSTSGKLHVAGAGNATGGNIHLGDNTDAAAKWTYITAAHYNGATNATGVSLIGHYATSTDNNINIGGNIYEAHPATTIAFYTYTSNTHTLGGTLRLTITKNGGFAFGTSASNYGTSGQVLQSNGDAAPTWVNQSSIAAGSAPLTNTYVGFGSGSNLLTGSANLTWDGTILSVLGASSNGYVKFASNTGTKLRFYDGTSDKYGVDVQSSELRIYSGAAGASTGGITFGKYDGTTYTQAAIIRNDGNVGINATAPVGKLSVTMSDATASSSVVGNVGAWDNTYALFGNAGSTTGAALALGYNSTYGSVISSLAPSVAWKNLSILSNDTIFYTSGTNERMRINSSGAIAFGGASNYGSSGQVLQSNGNAAPTWISQSSVAAGSATNALRIVFNDGARDLTDRLPNSYTRTVNWDFVNASIVGTSGNYAGVMSFSPWTGTTASTGDGSYQLAFGNASGTNASGQPTLRIRTGIDTTWGSWYTLLHAGNVGSYTAGAITNFTSAISSNPLNANSPNTINDIGYVSSNIPSSYGQGGSVGAQSDGGLYVSGYSTSWYHQIYGDFRTGGIAVRGMYSGTWQSWRNIPCVTVSDSAPSIYNPGDLWWESDTGRLKILYYDGSSSQWVDASPNVDTSLFFSKQGGAISGPVSINGALDVTGNISATAEITAYYSDRRLKADVLTIENALVKVKQLNGVTYRPNELAKSFGLDTNTDVVGLFADEVEAVLPQAVKPAPFDLDELGNSKSGENYKTIQYEKVVPLLVEAIKEQQSIIDAQQAKIDRLMKHLGLE